MQFGVRHGVLLSACLVLAACADAPPPEAAPAAAVAPRPGHIYLVVEKGQSLDRIAQTYRVAKHDIIAANHLTPPYALKPGTMLEIPVAAARPVAAAKPHPKPHAKREARAHPVHATGSAAAKQPKAKHSEPDVIPLD
ncbi:MAG: LysM peptidoglycan-binding domain-containing protein [Thiohalocapsa sp.]